MAVKLFFVFIFAFLASAVSLTPTDDEPDAPLRRQKRIVGGSLTTIEKYPFMAAIINQNGGNLNLVGGGTIVNKLFVLSAASCFPNDGNVIGFYVRVGSSFSVTGGILSKVNQFITYPGYNPLTQANNIGLIRLSTPLTYSATIKPAQLPSANSIVPTNSNGFFPGWGSNKPIGIDSVQTLRVVVVRVVDRNDCIVSAAIYQTAVSANTLCAQSPSPTAVVGSCLGDTGGPLVQNNVVVGVADRNFCAPYFPSIYTRVSPYINWIKANS